MWPSDAPSPPCSSGTSREGQPWSAIVAHSRGSKPSSPSAAARTRSELLSR